MYDDSCFKYQKTFSDVNSPFKVSSEKTNTIFGFLESKLVIIFFLLPLLATVLPLQLSKVLTFNKFEPGG